MLQFFAEHWATILGSLIIAGILVLIIVSQIRKKKKGSCGCGCKHCANRDFCHPSPKN